jgi:hypothetical protein
MKGLIRISTTIFVLALLASAQLHAEDAVFPVGNSANDKPIHWQSFSTGMSDQQYRNAYKNNQHRIGKFLKSYSENTLLSVGIPKTGVKVLGVAAGLAANRDATLYLNKSRILALQVKDATNENRAMFIGIKMDW